MNPKATTNENNIPTHWFDKGVALPALRHHFRQGTDTIRIASGFFSIRGYTLIRSAAAGKKLLILVGVKEQGEDRLKRVLIKEIKADILFKLTRTSYDNQ